MFDVRRRPTVVSNITSLAAAEEVANGPSTAGEGDGEEEGSEMDPVAGCALEKGERLRKELSETFVKLFADFWRKVTRSRGGSDYPNLYELVKIYLVQPHSSIECERGLSVQKLSAERLEPLMRLSLLHKQGLDVVGRYTQGSGCDFRPGVGPC